MHWSRSFLPRLIAPSRIRRAAGYALTVGAVPVVLATSLEAQAAGTDSARAALQRRMMRWVLPGDEHRSLARLAGDWDVTVALPGAPGRAPTVMNGRGSARMAVGDRFLFLDASVEGGGSSYSAVTVLGFDGRTERFTYLGFDSFGTYHVSAEGRGDPGLESLELFGTDRQSATETKHFTVRIDTAGPDAFGISIHFRAPDGGSFTVLEARYRRAAPRNTSP